MSDDTALPLPNVLSELEALEARKAELTALAAEARKTNLPLVVEGIKSYITGNGFTLDEILPLLMPKGKKASKPRAPRKEAPRASYTSKKDPSLVYSRGVLPQWLKDEMTAAGFNPDDKESRDKYKAEHMVSSLSDPTVGAVPAGETQAAA